MCLHDRMCSRKTVTCIRRVYSRVLSSNCRKNRPSLHLNAHVMHDCECRSFNARQITRTLENDSGFPVVLLENGSWERIFKDCPSRLDVYLDFLILWSFYYFLQSFFSLLRYLRKCYSLHSHRILIVEYIPTRQTRPEAVYFVSLALGWDFSKNASFSGVVDDNLSG